MERQMPSPFPILKYHDKVDAIFHKFFWSS